MVKHPDLQLRVVAEPAPTRFGFRLNCQSRAKHPATVPGHLSKEHSFRQHAIANIRPEHSFRRHINPHIQLTLQIHQKPAGQPGLRI
jgi:hypothetical protein